MEHVVFFPAPDGTPAFRRFAGLDEAVRFVEHLRNVENVSEASVHALTEVPLAFKTWYRVEVPSDVPAHPHGEVAHDAASSSVELPAAAGVPTPEAPGTIAEAIETYARPTPIDDPFAMPDVGSATGIVVPDHPLVGIDQLTQPVVAPAVPGAAAVATAGPILPGTPVVPASPAAGTPRPTPVEGDAESQAQVLEPAFGTRRERGMGFFAR